MSLFTATLVGNNPNFTDKSTRDEFNPFLNDNNKAGTSFAMESLIFPFK
jgi:hypothetical protein